MRILHVSDCYPPRLGGIETQVASLVAEQRKAGHDVRVLTLTAGPKDADTIRLGAIFQRSLLLRPLSTRDILAACEDFKPDVVHTHVGSGAWLGWAAVRAGRRLNIPTVLTIHSIWGRIARAVYGFRLQPREKFRWVAVSESAKQSIHANSNGNVIANGLNVSQWKSIETRSDRLTFITASRFVRRKRLVQLIEMFERLAHKHPHADFQLRIAGDGPQRQTLLKLIQSQHVVVLGRLSREELHSEFSTAHAYIQLSRLEAFGLAAAEAQASGLGVIGLQVSGISDFVQHNFDGFLGQSDTDIEQFLDATLENPEKLLTYSKNVNVESKPYQWTKVLAMYEALYQDVIGR